MKHASTGGPRTATTETFETSFPSSHKIQTTVEHDGFELSVPGRRVHLTGAEPPLDLYDTSGPQGHAAPSPSCASPGSTGGSGIPPTTGTARRCTTPGAGS